MFTRESVAILLRLARTVSDPQAAEAFAELAADLKDRIGERAAPPLETDAIRREEPSEK